MNLLPFPKELSLKEGYFYLSPKTNIVLDSKCNDSDLETALLLQKEILDCLGFKVNITKSFKKTENSIYLSKNNNLSESYVLTIYNCGIEITAVDDSSLFYGMQTLRQIIRDNGTRLSHLEIKDKPYFERRGFYHDVTRGKVPTLETIKELIDRCAYYKLNELQLYVEHSFAFKAHSELWADADPLTPEDILLLDEYAKKRHIELVPSLSTFGHLYHALSSHSYGDLCELEDNLDKQFSWIDRMCHHTLDVSNEKSIEFIRNMLEEFIPLFSSNKFNICCDETFDLGKGKSKTLAEEKGTVKLYVEFLNKIVDIVKEHNKQVMFWGDIILREPELVDEISKDVICLNWNYDSNCNDSGTKKFSELGRSQYVCPGVGGWNHWMNTLNNSFKNMRNMISYGKQYGALGVLNTDWGDYGHINQFANSIPGMIYGASLSWNPETCMEDINDVYEKISKVEYGDNTGSLVKLLAELSEKQIATHGHLVWWFDAKFKNNDLLKTNEWAKTEFEKINTKNADTYSHKALELGNDILNVCYKSNNMLNKKIDIEEFYISATAIALNNSLFRIIEKYDLNKDVDFIDEPKELAVKFENLIYDFSKVWRIRNKESELFRIKDMYKDICKWLRTL